MTELVFREVDVFAARPFGGNPLAVVAGADGLTGEEMARIANWTNFSETAFLLAPTHPRADYRVRIFTPQVELPFAGHPTLGSAFVWQSLGGVPKAGNIVQECGAGLVRLRESDGRLAFAAPPRRRSGPVGPDDLARALAALHLVPDDVLDAQWADNGPGWLALRLRGRAEVLAVEPDWSALEGMNIGVVGAWSPERDGTEAQFELRAFSGRTQGKEDPVTGSLNASVAQWLIESGIAPPRYVASQGAVLSRSGRIFVEREGGEIWIGGAVVTRVAGTISA